MADKVNHPKHYCVGRIRFIKVVEDWELGFNLGSVLKYIKRSKYKGSYIQDLKKALWYIAREIKYKGDYKSANLKCK